MKVAMIGLRGIPAKSGGVEHVVENLAPRLVKLGAEVTVFCRTPYCKDRPEEYKGVKLKYLPTINTKHLEAITHSKLATFNSLFKDYELIHYHAMGNAIFSFLPRIVGKKTIVTLHGLDYQREKWGKFATLYLKFCEKVIKHFPNHVISVSKKIKDHYIKRFGKEIEFIPNGVELHKPKKLTKLRKFLIRKNNYILFLSRIVPEKNVDLLIRAFKQINTDLKLVIVGDATHTDEYLKKCKDLAKRDNRIIFTGPLYGEDKYEAFSNARLFVLPSTIEGMPIVLLEAMSFGICPLVSDIKENAYVIEGKYGFTFKSNNEKDLIKQIQTLINSPLKTKQVGKLCKEMVKKNYQWDAVAKQTFELYKKALKK
jgi:glycosyltransferase involved in cell wall biosynthesis